MRRDEISGHAALALLAALALASPGVALADPGADDTPGESLSHKSFREASRTFFDDGAYLFTFPKRMTAKGIWLTAGVAAGTVLLVQEDDSIREHVLEDSDPGAAGRASDLFEPLGRWYVEAAALGISYGAARRAGRPGAVSTTATAFEAWLWSFVITTGAKVAFGRERPIGAADAHGFFEGGDIFPSGHTSRSFAIAAVLADRYGPRAAWIAYPVATLIGLATVQQDTHWASDVLAGAGLGLAIGKGIAGRHPAPEPVSGRATAPRAAWRIAPAAGGVMATITF